MQLDLEIKTKAPDVTPEMVSYLCRVLKGRQWVFAKTLQEETPYNARDLRAIAADSDGRIISGQKGYRYFDRETSIEEVDFAASDLESRARKMTKRATEIRRRYHKFNHS